jgi:uncharacterized membrane protein
MSTNQKTYNEVAGKKVGRIEAISDGVFAVALTLLVLDIKVPISETIKTEKDLMDAFCGLTPKFLTYFLSFMTLGIFWTGHSSQYNFIEKSDRNLNWMSLFFLLFVSVLPFTTGFLSEHIHFKFSVFLYWANIFVLGFTLLIHWNYAIRKKYVALPDEERVSIGKAIQKRIIIAQTLYAIAALLCLINIYLSITVTILIQLNYALAPFEKLNRTAK